MSGSASERRRPVGRPVALSRDARVRRTAAPPCPTRASTTCSLSWSYLSPPMTGARVGAAGLRKLELHLSPRDLAVLRSLDEHRYLLTSQLQRLHFAAHRSPSAGIRACVRTLDRLQQLRLVTRLTRQIGGRDSGSRGFVWTLDEVGYRLLRREADEPTTRRRRFEPTVLFLEHTLAVAEARVQFEETARASNVELLGVQTEPGCWRDYVGAHGQPATLKPDLALITATSDYEDHWFIEVDRGTESIRTVLAKCAQYEAYRQSGREQAKHGVFPLVVWSMPDARRRARLEDELAHARELDPALFRVVAPEGVVALITGVSPPSEATDTTTSTSPHERRTP